ncbi:MAG: hypothetical protein ACE5GH_07075, partial [Fidelibacterota bacterium]
MRMDIRAVPIMGVLLLLSSCGSPDLVGRNLISPAPGGSRYPNLYVTAEGTLLMSWIRPLAGKDYVLEMAELAGEEWTSPRTIFTGERFFVNWADFPSIYQVNGDTLVAHWLYRSGGGTYEYDVSLSVSDDRGKTWSEPASPHRDGVLAEHGFLSFFQLSSGGLGMAWLDGRDMTFDPHDEIVSGGAMALVTTTLEKGGLLGPEVVLDDRVCECCPTAAISTGKVTVVAYRDRSLDEVRNIQVVRHTDGGWSKPVTVHEDNWSIPGCPVNGPVLAAHGG